MAHGRQLIREAAVSLLLGQTNAGSNVFANRETILFPNQELPAINITSKEESAIPRDISGRQSIRTLTLEIQLKVAANDTVDDNLDDLAKQVEDIISTNPSLTCAAVSSVEYQSTQIILDATSDTEIGVATLSFEVKYIQ